MKKRFRIGNDLTVLWAINNRDGSPYDLSGKEVKLFVTHSRGRMKVNAILETLPDGEINNVIRWDFSGLDQMVLGTYMLTIEIYASEDKKLIKKDICEAFELVSQSDMEDEDSGEEVMEDGILYLSSKLDIYRFGIPKIKIGPNGNWFIDNADTKVSALGGGPGLVRDVYFYEDLESESEFDPESVIDTFNAYAIALIAQRVKKLEADDYLQIGNMTDVLYEGKPQLGQTLVWDGTRWRNKTINPGVSGGGGGGGSITVDSAMSDTSTNPAQNKVVKKYVDDKHNELAFLKDMFYWEDKEHTVIGTKYPFFSESTVTAGGRKTEEDSEGSGITITDVADYLEQQGYATEQWVKDQKYATTSALKSLSDKVDSIESNGVDLSGYATEQWVKAQGYMTSTSLEATFSEIGTRLKALEKLLDWFEFDETAQMIKAKFGIYSVGAITAAKKEEEE